MANSNYTTKAVILVGGDTRGTRFRPLSLDTPKVLFPIGGKPLISHIIDPISKISSIRDVLIIGFYENSVFTDFLYEAKHKYPNLNIKYLREYKALGTAGGLFHFRDEIKRNNPDKIFVVHGDIICSFPFAEILDFYAKQQDYYDDNEAKAVIFGIDVPKYLASHPHTFGAIVSDKKTHKVIHYVEKPESKISDVINGGIYLFNSKYIINKIAQTKHAKDELVDDITNVDTIDNDVISLENDILAKLPDDGSFYVYKSSSYWRQIKRAASALPANDLALANAKYDNSAQKATIIEPVFIHPTAKVAASAKIGPNVSIGPNTVINEGVRIKDSIVLDNVEVDEHSLVLYSIISRDTKIGKWVRVEGSKIQVNDPVTYFQVHDIKFSKATILSSNTHVADDVYVKNCVVLPDKAIKTDAKLEIVM